MEPMGKQEMCNVFMGSDEDLATPAVSHDKGGFPP